jgi:hypothetical protein
MGEAFHRRQLVTFAGFAAPCDQRPVDSSKRIADGSGYCIHINVDPCEQFANSQRA